MQFIAGVIEKLQRHPKRIVFPEGTEPRVIRAARQYRSLGLGAPVLLGHAREIQQSAEQLEISLEGIRIIDPAESEDLDNFAERYAFLRRSRGLPLEEARKAMLNPNYFGAMMLAMHQVDGFVSGVRDVTSSVLRPLFHIVRVAPRATTAASCTILELPDQSFGHQGVLFLADCAVLPEPNVQQLADIAVSTAALARQILGIRPRVAFLSFSTKGSSSHSSIVKLQAATALAQQQAYEQRLEADFDGELQADAALVPDIARIKAPHSRVAGRATVLIFPDLNSGNIASRMVQHLAHATAYGHILLGMDRPAAEVSRGASPREILGVAGIVGVQSIAYHLLYPEAGKYLPGETRAG